MSELYGFKKNLEKVQVRSKSESAAKSHLVPTKIATIDLQAPATRYQYAQMSVPDLANWNVVVLTCRCGNIAQNLIFFRAVKTEVYLVDALTSTTTRGGYTVDWANNRILVRWVDGNESLAREFVRVWEVYGLVQNVDVVDQDTEDEPSGDEGEDIDITGLTEEVLGIRIAADGTIYETAGEAVRQQYEKLSQIMSALDIDSASQTINDLIDDVNAAVDAAIEQIETAGGLILDPTLTQSGQAADAKVVGDKIEGVKSDLTYERQRIGEYDKGLFVHPLIWSRGTINTASGADQDNNYRIRTNKINVVGYSELDITIPSGYQFYYFIYDGNDTVLYKYGWQTAHYKIDLSQYPTASYVRYIIQDANGSSIVVPLSIAYEIIVTSESLLLKRAKNVSTCYVSTDGNDSNNGTKSSPFATVQHAIEAGFKSICITAGEYHQSLSVSNVDGLNIYADNTDEYVSYTKKARPLFTNGTFFDTFSIDGNGYKYFALDDAPSTYNAVFITHAQEPIITGNYPSYRASLWANHNNKYDDFRVKPVLTYEELSEDNTFYYDGTNVYFHISDTLTGVTVGGATSYIFNFINCNNLTVNGIDFMYADSMNFQVLRSNNVRVSNCNFGYTMRSNCVTASYSNVVFENCESFKATIDGFNSHYYGVSVFNNCRGLYNYDDGESSHEYCEVIVNGGEYSHNGKGGHAPVNGCSFKCNGTYTHDNGYGFYMVGSASFETEDVLISNSVAKNNTTYDLQNTIYNTKLWNNIIGTQHISSGTVLDLSS